MNNVKFEDWKAKQLEDPEIRAAYEDLEAASLVVRLRVKRGLTQQQLADLVGTKQSSIARLESGASQPRLSFLRRIIEALGGRLQLNVVDSEKSSREHAEHQAVVITYVVGENFRDEHLGIYQPFNIYTKTFDTTTETITTQRVLQ
jgi:transcriptional regulator with XRE-family HTH domain